VLKGPIKSHNKALRPRANPLRGLSAAELGRSTEKDEEEDIAELE